MNIFVLDIDNIGLTSFKLAMPDHYRSDDPVQSYRDYYMGDKRNIASWKKRSIPDWYE